MAGGLDAIYGIDDREYVSWKSPLSIQRMSSGVALIVEKSSLKNVSKNKVLISASTLEENVGLCRDERFSQNLSMSSCTGFLVGEDLLLTAGHCLADNKSCSHLSFVFSVKEAQEKENGYLVSSDQIFSCKEVVKREFGQTSDYALLRLEKKAKKSFIPRHVFKMNFKNNLTPDDRVFMLGHPLGQAQMISQGRKVLEVVGDDLFIVKLNSFLGNSGSPVINSKTHEVEGILINGNDDFDSGENGCFYNLKHGDNAGEGVLRSSVLKSILKK